MKQLQSLIPLLVILLAGAVLGCGEAPPSKSPSTKSSSTKSTASGSAATKGGADAGEAQKARRVRVVDDKKQPQFTFRLRADQVVIDVYDGVEERTLRGFGSPEGKRRYKIAKAADADADADTDADADADAEASEGGEIAIVMALQNGFEVRGPDDAKLWHVRIKDDQILVNSAELGQYRLRRKDRNVALHKGDVLLARARDSAKHDVVLVRDPEGVLVRRVFAEGNPIAAALTSASEIPPDQLAILVAELLLRSP